MSPQTHFPTFGFGVDPLGNRRRPMWSNVVVWVVVLPAASLWACYRIFTTATGPGFWALTFALYIFSMFGVTLGNHRYWTHRGFKAREPLKWVMAVAGGMSVQGSIQQWAMTHRAHHRYADVVGIDPHSPYEYPGWRGLVWAQGVWLLFQNPVSTHFQIQRDLAEDPVVRWEHKAFPYLAGGQFVALMALYPLFGLNAVLIAGGLRVTALLTTTGLVNSVCHRWGTRARDSRGEQYRSDDSRNNVLVALLTAGEGNHSWHHTDPACPRHGRKVDLDPEAVTAGKKRDHVLAAGRDMAADSASRPDAPDLRRQARSYDGVLRRQAARTQRESEGAIARQVTWSSTSEWAIKSRSSPALRSRASSPGAAVSRTTE